MQKSSHHSLTMIKQVDPECQVLFIALVKLSILAGLLNRLNWMSSTYPWQQGDVACFKTSSTFVDSLAEMLAPLVAGDHFPHPFLLAPVHTTDLRALRFAVKPQSLGLQHKCPCPFDFLSIYDEDVRRYILCEGRRIYPA